MLQEDAHERNNSFHSLVHDTPAEKRSATYNKLLPTDKEFLFDYVEAIRGANPEAHQWYLLCADDPDEGMQAYMRGELAGMYGQGFDEVGPPRVRSASELDDSAPNWLWYPLIPADSLTALIGLPEAGKTALMAFITAQVTRGLPLPNFSKYPQPIVKREPGYVLYYNGETPDRAFRKRMEKAGADMELTKHVGMETDWQLDQIDILRKDVATLPSPPRLIVFDTLAVYMPPGKGLENMSDMRRLLRPLAAYADEIQCAIVMLHHEGKGQRANMMHVGVGSIGIMAQARSAIFCGQHPDQEDRRVMLHVKSSEEAKANSAIYRMERIEIEIGNTTAKLCFDGIADVDPLDVINGISSADKGAERATVEDASDWLQKTLADGPVASKSLETMAKRDQLLWGRVRKASDGMVSAGILWKGKRDPGDGKPYREWPYVWMLCLHEAEPCKHTQPRTTRIDTAPSLLAHGCTENGVQAKNPENEETMKPVKNSKPEPPSAGDQMAYFVTSECPHEGFKHYCQICHHFRPTGEGEWRPPNLRQLIEGVSQSFDLDAEGYRRLALALDREHDKLESATRISEPPFRVTGVIEAIG